MVWLRGTLESSPVVRSKAYDRFDSLINPVKAFLVHLDLGPESKKKKKRHSIAGQVKRTTLLHEIFATL